MMYIWCWLPWLHWLAWSHDDSSGRGHAYQLSQALNEGRSLQLIVGRWARLDNINYEIMGWYIMIHSACCLFLSQLLQFLGATSVIFIASLYQNRHENPNCLEMPKCIHKFRPVMLASRWSVIAMQLFFLAILPSTVY